MNKNHSQTNHNIAKRSTTSTEEERTIQVRNNMPTQTTSLNTNQPNFFTTASNRSNLGHHSNSPRGGPTISTGFFFHQQYQQQKQRTESPSSQSGSVSSQTATTQEGSSIMMNQISPLSPASSGVGFNKQIAQKTTSPAKTNSSVLVGAAGMTNSIGGQNFQSSYSIQSSLIPPPGLPSPPQTSGVFKTVANNSSSSYNNPAASVPSRHSTTTSSSMNLLVNPSSRDFDSSPPTTTTQKAPTIIPTHSFNSPTRNPINPTNIQQTTSTSSPEQNPSLPSTMVEKPSSTSTMPALESEPPTVKLPSIYSLLLKTNNKDDPYLNQDKDQNSEIIYLRPIAKMVENSKKKQSCYAHFGNNIVKKQSSLRSKIRGIVGSRRADDFAKQNKPSEKVGMDASTDGMDSNFKPKQAEEENKLKDQQSELKSLISEESNIDLSLLNGEELIFGDDDMVLDDEILGMMNTGLIHNNGSQFFNGTPKHDASISSFGSLNTGIGSMISHPSTPLNLPISSSSIMKPQVSNPWENSSITAHGIDNIPVSSGNFFVPSNQKTMQLTQSFSSGNSSNHSQQFTNQHQTTINNPSQQDIFNNLQFVNREPNITGNMNSNMNNQGQYRDESGAIDTNDFFNISTDLLLQGILYAQKSGIDLASLFTLTLEQQQKQASSYNESSHSNGNFMNYGQSNNQSMPNTKQNPSGMNSQVSMQHGGNMIGNNLQPNSFHSPNMNISNNTSPQMLIQKLLESSTPQRTNTSFSNQVDSTQFMGNKNNNHGNSQINTNMYQSSYPNNASHSMMNNNGNNFSSHNYNFNQQYGSTQERYITNQPQHIGGNSSNNRFNPNLVSPGNRDQRNEHNMQDSRPELKKVKIKAEPSHHPQPMGSQPMAGRSETPESSEGEDSDYSNTQSPGGKKKKKSHVTASQVGIVELENNEGFECSFCSRKFKRKSDIKVHIRRHTGERPYICEIDGCGKKFTTASNLRRHNRNVHTGAAVKE